MIYLDHAATTPVFESALRAAWPWLTTEFGNPSSRHELGLAAAAALADARAAVAEILGFASHELIFTSGATESNNLAIKSLALAAPRGTRLITARTEHSSVLASIDFLAQHHGFAVEYLEIDSHGRLSLADLAEKLHPALGPAVVALAWVNNESGVVHPIAEIAQLCHAANVSLHVDAVQAMVVPTLDPARDLAGATSVAISGHKFGAPKGSGALAVRATAPFDSVSSGGGQEFGLRSGTQNVAWAVALATALREQRSPAVLAAGQEFAEQTRRFITAVRQAVPGACLVGPPLDSADAGARSPAVASFVFEGFSGESILLDLERRGVVASSGSACAAGSGEPSHVLKAMGYSADQALTAVRFSFSNPALRAKWAGEAGGGGGGGVGGGGTESRAPLNVERVVAALVAAVDRAR